MRGGTGGTGGSVSVFGDPLGPRGRRRVLVASILSLAVIALLVVVAVNRLADTGQLDRVKWEPLTRFSILKFYWGGLVNTVKAAVTAMVIALAIGTLMALGRLARNRLVRWSAGLYVEFFRGLPLYLLILFSWLGLPKLGVDLPVFWYLVLALAVYNSSILAEIFRAGILSLDKGQGEAAKALGMSYWQSMALVIVPQAVRRMIPAIVSQLVTLLKDTSLGILVAYEELLRRAKITYEFLHNPVHAVALVALIYIAVNLTLSQVATRLEARQRRRYKAGGITVAGVEELELSHVKVMAKVDQLGGGAAVV